MSGPRFRGDVEGLRGIAVLLVVAQHVWGLPSGGFVGVDVFFVISGYVITAGLLREHASTGTLSYRAFVVRRVRRLLPAALLVTVVTVLVSRVVFVAPRFQQVVGDAVASVLSVQNWRLIRQGTDYFQEGAASPLQHYWSLSVEEQFYVLWPLLLLGAFALLRRRGRSADGERRALAVLVLLAIVASFTIAVLESAFRPGWAYFSLESRAWELGVGALLAIVAPRVGRVSSLTRGPLRVGGLVLIVGAAVGLDGDVPFPGPWALLPVLGAAAVIAAGEGPTEVRSRLLGGRAIRYTGRISYALYLWHFPAVVVSGLLLWWSPVLAATVALVASVVLAALTRHLVEGPVSRLPPVRVRRRSSRSESVMAVVVVLALVVVVGVQVRGPESMVSADIPGAVEGQLAAADGAFPDASVLSGSVRSALAADAWPAGVSLDALRPADGAAQTVARRGCLVDAGAASAELESMVERCATGASDSPRTAVVLGDSIAMSWLPAVTGALEPLGWRVVGLGVESCPAVDVSSAERAGRAEFVAACTAARAEMIDVVTGMAPDLVVLSSGLGSFERLVSGARGEDAVREWRTGTMRAVDDLRSTGAAVAVLGSPPETRAVSACASPLTGPAACIAAPSEAWTEKAAAERVALAGFASDEASFVPVGDWFCAGGRCPAFVDGSIVTVDGGHLTLDVSTRLSGVVRAALAPLLTPIP